MNELDGLVPFEDASGDWQEVLVLARRPRRPRRRALRGRRAAIAVAVAALALAAPALAFLLGWIDRRDVSFQRSRSAPNVVKKRFLDLGIGAPPRFALHVEAARAREVGVFVVRGRRRKLWVAPTRGGGFCFTFEQAFGGCQRSGDRRRFPLSVTTVGAPNGDTVAGVGGTISAARAARIELRYEDGSCVGIPFVFVSRPIAAGFFTFDVPRAHWAKHHRAKMVVALDRRGNVLARETFGYETHPRPVRLPHGRRTPSPLPPVTAPPSPPLQRATANGATVVAGANGGVVFDLARLDPGRRALMRNVVSYGCFRLTREFGIFGTRGYGVEGPFEPVVRIRMNGVRPPFDACELSAEAGHRWPDRFGSHAPVELPLTARGRSFFADRAAARDVALFVRTRLVQQITREPVAEAVRDLRAAYPALARSAIRIRVDGGALVFSEGRFRIVVRDGKIASENVKPYALVF